jgi:deoxycytidine triphosphate deaminase
MTVINIRDRITSEESKFVDYSFSDQSFIHTDSLKEKPDQFSFELSVGDGWALKYSETETQLIAIPDNGINIPGRGSVVVQVREKIKIPHNLYGIILPTGSLFLSSGILIAPAKIEPSFQGYLKLRLFNTTSESHRLKKGDKLASAVFFHTEVTRFNSTIHKTSEIAKTKDGVTKKLGRWFAANRNVAIGWVISLLCSSAVSSLALYFAYYKPTLNKPPAPPAIVSEEVVRAVVEKITLEKENSKKNKRNPVQPKPPAKQAQAAQQQAPQQAPQQQLPQSKPQSQI